MMLAPNLLAHLARPIRMLNTRSRQIEEFLQTPLAAQDEKVIREACDATGVRFGEFYHWYLQKLIVARTIQGIDRKRAMKLIGSVDCTDYDQMRPIVDSGRGVLIAVPHYAHYVFSMVALTERLRFHRKINIFYGQPETHQGNKIFDQFHSLFWGVGSNVAVIHDTRQGLAKAVRGLKSGEVVFIMPDALQSEDQALIIPFCNRPMSVMLGTAILARKTDAWVQPLISTCAGRGMGFRTLFGERIDHDLSPGSALNESSETIRILDYRLMRKLFGQYESVMAPEIIYWQNMRSHLMRDGSFRDFERDDLQRMAGLLESDPDLIPDRYVIDLRTAVG